ncbi:hypothetical protein JMJ77_0001335, partial [Colletotrichum scovillei]
PIHKIPYRRDSPDDGPNSRTTPATHLTDSQRGVTASPGDLDRVSFSIYQKK